MASGRNTECLSLPAGSRAKARCKNTPVNTRRSVRMGHALRPELDQACSAVMLVGHFWHAGFATREWPRVRCIVTKKRQRSRCCRTATLRTPCFFRRAPQAPIAVEIITHADAAARSGTGLAIRRVTPKNPSLPRHMDTTVTSLLRRLPNTYKAKPRRVPATNCTKQQYQRTALCGKKDHVGMFREGLQTRGCCQR